MGSACVVPLRAFDRRRFKNIVVDVFSVAPEVAELLVPEGLFSVKFETHERIPGVR
jgi:translation initiation factor 2D